MGARRFIEAEEQGAISNPFWELPETLRTILDSTAEGVVVGEGGRIVLFNFAAQQILRTGSDARMSERWWDDWRWYRADAITPYPPEQLPLARALRGETVEEEEVFARHSGAPKERWLMVNAWPLRDTGGAVRAGIVSFRDNTPCHECEENLRRSGDWFHSLIGNVSDVIWAIDSDGTIQFQSPSTEKALGYKAGELVGKNTTELLHPEDREKIYNIRQTAVQHPGVDYVIDVRWRHKDGSWRTFEVLEQAVIDRGGTAVIVLTARDVTERKHAEEELRASRKQLRHFAARLESAREDERTRIARELHDQLGQSLTAVKIELSHIARRRESETELVRDLKSASQLVDTILESVHRISTELRPSILDSLGLASAVEWQTREFQSRTGIRASVTRPARDVKYRRGVSTAVFRIFEEILTNVARHANATAVSVTLEDTGGDLVLRVKDNGRGITSQQIDDPTSLGLLGMRERAVPLGGEIRVAADPAGGTSVMVRIPRSAGKRNPRRTEIGGSRPPAQAEP